MWSGRTLLALVEDWGSRMVEAHLVRPLGEGLATPLVDALERHLGDGGRFCQQVREGQMDDKGETIPICPREYRFWNLNAARMGGRDSVEF